jgi:hypothetical protein
MLRDCLQRVRQGDYQEVTDAVDNLDNVVREFFPTTRKRKHGSLMLAWLSQKKVRNQLNYQRARSRFLRRKLGELKAGKQGKQQNRMTPEFLAQMALSMPSVCARGFSDAWVDLVGVGISGCSRPTITRVRNAFVEVIKELVVHQVVSVAAAAVRAHSAACALAAAYEVYGSAGVAPVVCLWSFVAHPRRSFAAVEVFDQSRERSFSRSFFQGTATCYQRAFSGAATVTLARRAGCAIKQDGACSRDLFASVAAHGCSSCVPTFISRPRRPHRVVLHIFGWCWDIHERSSS